MRILRALTIAASVVALPSLATAQQGRPFKDAWFWGVKAGGLSVADTGGSYSFAPMIGVEWLITRTHGGLYISAGQAFFNQRRLPTRDPDAPADTGFASSGSTTCAGSMWRSWRSRVNTTAGIRTAASGSR